MTLADAKLFDLILVAIAEVGVEKSLATDRQIRFGHSLVAVTYIKLSGPLCLLQCFYLLFTKKSAG